MITELKEFNGKTGRFTEIHRFLGMFRDYFTSELIAVFDFEYDGSTFLLKIEDAEVEKRLLRLSGCDNGHTIGNDFRKLLIEYDYYDGKPWLDAWVLRSVEDYEEPEEIKL